MNTKSKFLIATIVCSTSLIFNGCSSIKNSSDNNNLQSDKTIPPPIASKKPLAKPDWNMEYQRCVLNIDEAIREKHYDDYERLSLKKLSIAEELGNQDSVISALMSIILALDIQKKYIDEVPFYDRLLKLAEYTQSDQLASIRIGYSKLLQNLAPQSALKNLQDTPDVPANWNLESFKPAVSLSGSASLQLQDKTFIPLSGLRVVICNSGIEKSNTKKHIEYYLNKAKRIASGNVGKTVLFKLLAAELNDLIVPYEIAAVTTSTDGTYNLDLPTAEGKYLFAQYPVESGYLIWLLPIQSSKTNVDLSYKNCHVVINLNDPEEFIDTSTVIGSIEAGKKKAAAMKEHSDWLRTRLAKLQQKT